MPTENPFPLNISNKVNSPTLLAWFAQFGEEGYLSADEINKMKIALEYLYETINGETSLFLGSYTSLENLQSAHPSPEPGSRANIIKVDDDDDLALWDNGDASWFIITGAGGVSLKEDKASGVIAYGTDNYTATFPEVTSLLFGQKFHCFFENSNTGASTLNPNGLGVKEIRKEGDVQLVADDLKGARLLMYDGEHFQVVSHFGSGGSSSGAETFSILWSPDGVYGEQNMNFNTVDQFKFSPAHSFQNAFTSVNSSTTSVDPVAPGFVIPYDCVLFKAIIRFGYSDSSPGRRDVQIFAQVGDSSSAPTFMNENLNKVILINTRINEGVTGFFSQDTTVNNIPIIDVNHVIPANSVFKHMVAGKYNLGTLRFQLQYFFRKV